MDAAEAVFSERGYYGSSLRDISSRCGAALGLINHYFVSKEDLFNAVIDRKRDVLAELVRRSLESASGSGGGDVQAVIAAFVSPFLRACAQNSGEISNYIRLTSHFMSSYGAPEITPALLRLKPISDLFDEHLRRALPNADAEQVAIALYFIEAALIFMVQDRGFLRSVTDGRFDVAAVNELIRPAATFFAAGVAALIPAAGETAKT